MKIILYGLFLFFCLKGTAQVPSAPGSVVATGINGGGYITFTAPSTVGTGITNYQYSTNNGSSWTSASPAVTASPLTITGLTNCNTYQIKIRAVNASGNGTASATANLVPTASTEPGITWTSRTSAADISWRSVAYGNGMFVAVAVSGTGNRVMSSPDGINWTARISVADFFWQGVTFGNGMFVAVSSNSTDGNKTVMTSSDGITWTASAAPLQQWVGVTYGNGVFVSVGVSGTGNRVMTSTNGTSWTSRTSAADVDWASVTYGNGLFVAVADSSDNVSRSVMTSTDGTTWTARSAPIHGWVSITYGNGLFVAVSNSVPESAVMTSPDGITWTLRTPAVNNAWRGITYGNGMFVAVSTNGSGNRAMTSTDGITWNSRTSAANNAWFGITYGNGMFVAVASSGTGNRVMSSSLAVAPNTPQISTTTAGLASASVTYTASLSTILDAPAVSNVEYSTDNGSTWTTPSPAVTTSPLSISGLATGTFQVKIRPVNKVGTGCASSASSVTVVPNTWIGGSGNWNVAANWSGNAVPDGVSDITISSGTPTLDVDFNLPAGKSLAISGTGSLIVAPGKRLTLAGTADFGDRPVTFSSTSSGTASLGQVTGTLSNATNVTVERYLPLGRKWRLLTAPLKGSTNNSIFYNWQNNDAISAGRGVEIWGAAGDADPSNNNSGLAIGGGASMRAYGTTGWTNVTNTNTTLLFDNSTNFGYALFATGPYNNGTSPISPTNPAQNTTLSATGTLITGDHTKTFNAGSGGQYFLVGNPYASPVDPRSFTATGTINRTNLNDKLWMWDAKPGPGIGNGLGKYVSFDLSINQFNLYSDGYPDDNVMIQSGQAFFVQSAASGTATLIFRESSKNASGSHAMMGNSTSSPKARLRLTLQQPVTGDSVLNLDGAVAVFHAEGRTAIDPLDGDKLMNSAENLFFRREEKSLTFEHHPKVTARDTLFVRMSNLQARSYKLQLQAADFSDTDSLTAALIDRFTGKTHPISLKGSSDHTFTVTLDSLSTGDRFLVVLTKITAPILMKPDAQEGNYGVKLFPNPVRNRLRVSMGVSDTGPYSITVVNAAGVEIWKKSGIQTGTKTVDVNASDFHNGVYMLILRDAKGDVRVDRFVKE